MHRARRLAVAILLTAAFFMGSHFHAQAGSIRASTTSTLKRLVLNARDFPSGYRQTRLALVTNAESALSNHDNKALLDRKGRVASFETAFAHPSKKGAMGVLDGVTAYKSPAGAAWDYGRQTRTIAAQLARAPKQYHAVEFRVAGIGRRAIGFQTLDFSQKTPLTDIGILFTSKRYWASVLTIAPAKVYTRASVEHLARTIASRIASRG